MKKYPLLNKYIFIWQAANEKQYSYTYFAGNFHDALLKFTSNIFLYEMYPDRNRRLDLYETIQRHNNEIVKRNPTNLDYTYTLLIKEDPDDRIELDEMLMLYHYLRPNKGHLLKVSKDSDILFEYRKEKYFFN